MMILQTKHRNLLKKVLLTSVKVVIVVMATASLTLSLAGCKKRVLPTSVCVVDSIRHYYPVVAGEKLNLSYIVKNIGDEPFLIDDIQPSCGCINTSVDVRVIPPQDSIILNFTFDSSKNVGYVRHCIRLYGNVRPRGMATLVFDVNVVPPSSDQPDYEEIYQKEAEDAIKEMVDGKTTEKGYYVSSDASIDSRVHKKYPWYE